MKMPEQPRVSIISVYYNRKNFVTASVQSLLSQNYPELEIILVDDGSTDGTLEALQRFTDPRVRVVTGSNQGFVNALRGAVETAQGSLIAIHGSGDVSQPQRVEKQVQFLQNHPEVGMVGCYVANVNSTTQTFGNFEPVIIDGMAVGLKDKSPYTHGEVMFRKSLYDEVGGYRTFFKYAQDYDLWLRMSRRAKFGVVPETLYTRFARGDGVELDPEKKVQQLLYADFAVQCFESLDETGKDLVDRFGQDALKHRKPSSKLANEIWSKAMDALAKGDTAAATRLNAMSRQEVHTFKNSAAHLLLSAATKWAILRAGLIKSVAFGKALKRRQDAAFISPKTEGSP
jgi:hypothetical protein